MQVYSRSLLVQEIGVVSHYLQIEQEIFSNSRSGRSGRSQASDNSGVSRPVKRRRHHRGMDGEGEQVEGGGGGSDDFGCLATTILRLWLLSHSSGSSKGFPSSSSLYYFDGYGVVEVGCLDSFHGREDHSR